MKRAIIIVLMAVFFTIGGLGMLFAAFMDANKAHAADQIIPTQSGGVACVPDYEGVRKRLNDKFDEQRRFDGFSNTGVVIELYVSEKSQTYSLMVLRPDGLFCLIDAGEGGAVYPPVAPLGDPT